jgi:uncharacterized membrane protein YeaQ/YmgE (transglycosylase-associated protein family)
MARRRRSNSTSRQVRRALRKVKPIWILKIILYGLGIYSFLYCQREYPLTLISFKTVVIIGIISGFIASLIIEREIKYYIFSIILLGSLCTGILFKINRTFVHKKEEKFKLHILDKALRSAKLDHSQVSIEYDDFDRDIIIGGDQEYKLAPAQFIILTVRKGGLGYYIITFKELAEK